MAKILSGLITLALVLVAALTLLSSNVLDREARREELRHQERMNQIEEDAARQAEARRQARAEAMEPWKRTTLQGMLVGSLATAAVAGYFLTQNLKKRSQLVHVNEAGIFPAIRVKLQNGATLIHDANRAQAATTVYSSDRDGNIVVMPIVPPGLEDATRQAVMQASAVQLVRAGVSGGAQLTEDVERTARKFFPQDSGPRVSEVKVLESTAADAKQLITEAREHAQADDNG